MDIQSIKDILDIHDGTAGSSGTSGSSGTTGNSGSSGTTGASGTSGTSGDTNASGSDGWIQYAKTSVLGADSKLKWDVSTTTLLITGSVTASSLQTTLGGTHPIGAVQAQFGLSHPTYILADNPAIGFNADFLPTRGWMFGPGSNTYASVITMIPGDGTDPTHGAMQFWSSKETGSSSQVTTWLGDSLLTLYPTGKVEISGSLAFTTNDVTSSTAVQGTIPVPADASGFLTINIGGKDFKIALFEV